MKIIVWTCSKVLNSVNTFHAIGLFPYSLKTAENQGFPNVFGEKEGVVWYRKRLVT